MIGYPLDRLHEEVAFLGYYLHWDFETILNMEHRDRMRWCDEASKINKQVSGVEEKKNMFDV